jgi:hypothetical protein
MSTLDRPFEDAGHPGYTYPWVYPSTPDPPAANTAQGGYFDVSNPSMSVSPPPANPGLGLPPSPIWIEVGLPFVVPPEAPATGP